MYLTPLAPLDYVFTGNLPCPVSFAFAYSEQLDPKHMQESLDRLVSGMPLLGGRLRAQGASGYAYDSDRAEVVLEVVDAAISLGEPSDLNAIRLVQSRDGEPLMTARLTQTPNGSILGVSMSHALVDGFSFFLTVSKWAACLRGDAVDHVPVSRLLQASEAQVASAAADLTPRTLLERTGLFWATRRPDTRRLPAQDRVRLSAEAVADIAAVAQADVDSKLSRNDVLTAWLWRMYGRRWWAGRGNPTVYMSCPVDVRRLFGEANASAFGCSIACATAQASFEELMTAPLGTIALKIKRSVAAVFADGLERRVAPLEALRRRHGLQAMESVHFRHPEYGMLVTNMSRLPLAALDFGCGAPIDLKLFSGFDSMAAVLPAREGIALSVYRPAGHAARAPSRPHAARELSRS